MKWNIDDAPIFVAVVDQNGFTAAANALKMPKSTVSKSISRLEQALGIRLLDRNSRNLRMTSEGETFYRKALLIMEQVRETDAAMAGLSAVPSGNLVAALPPAFCQEVVAPNLGTFRDLYPNIQLDLHVTTHPIDILREHLDVAVVVGPQEDSELISKTLFSGRLVWVASPHYLDDNDLGETPSDLLAHVKLCETRYGRRKVPVRLNGQLEQLELDRGIIHVNDPLSVRRAVLNGAGVSLLPELYCREHLREGLLVEVRKDIGVDLSASTLSIVTPSRRLTSPRTRVFVEFLERLCQT